MRHLTLHQRIFEGQMIASVNQQLIFQMLWWMEVFAGRLLPIASSLPLVDTTTTASAGKQKDCSFVTSLSSSLAH
jgi:hypothetical protein